MKAFELNILPRNNVTECRDNIPHSAGSYSNQVCVFVSVCLSVGGGGGHEA